MLTLVLVVLALFAGPVTHRPVPTPSPSPSPSPHGVTLHGTAGPDRIMGTSGIDVIDGQGGDDTIFAVDGQPDRIDCGPGRDRVVTDVFDHVRNCERVEQTIPDLG